MEVSETVEIEAKRATPFAYHPFGPTKVEIIHSQVNARNTAYFFFVNMDMPSNIIDLLMEYTWASFSALRSSSNPAISTIIEEQLKHSVKSLKLDVFDSDTETRKDVDDSKAHSE